jgi:micrococcal nuclease
MKRFVLIAAFAVLSFLCTDVNAASMFGKVVDVSSGDVITISNLKRPVRVKLVGVDAPEVDQAFGDLARKHLSDLIHEKTVVVEYSGIAADGSVVGRVLLNDADIGAQMIRDGAAWFDPNNLSRLSIADREVYQQAQQAARDERRGLWQSENPTAPWEFVRARALRTVPPASVNPIAPAPKAERERSNSELTNLTLMSRGSGSAPSSRMMSTNEKDFAWAEAVPTKATWSHFRPDGEDFSALVPEKGERMEKQFQLGGEMVDMNVYLARDGWSTYLVEWVRAKAFNETDKSALDNAVQGFSMGLKEGFGEQSGSSCGTRNEKYINVSGNAGIEFEVASCVLQGRGRIVTTRVNGKRTMYILAVLYVHEDDNIPRFLNSLTVDTPPKTTPRRR